MLKRLLLALSTALAVTPVAAPPAAAQPAPAAPLDAAARQAVVAQLGAALRERYVFPDNGAQAAAKIDAALAAR